METVTIDIDATGNTTVSVSGVSGGRCKDVTREVEKALGQKTADKLTAEFHKREEVRHEQRF